MQTEQFSITEKPNEFAALAEKVMQRCDELASLSENDSDLFRPFACQSMKSVHLRLEQWLSSAGAKCRTDAICNLIGRYGAELDTSKTLLIGSHIDTVPTAGRYDGMLGVMLGVAAIEFLAAKGIRLPFNIDVIAFSDEEGIRFHTSYLGSRAVAGQFDPELLDWRDKNDVSMREAIEAFGQSPNEIAYAAYDAQDVIGYFEAHIEQGPVLERKDIPVGVVSSIAGQSRVNVTLEGKAGHAGTVPMSERQDALVAAAAFISETSRCGLLHKDLVATVGSIENYPNASNVIPARVRLSLDVRHSDDEKRRQAISEIFGVGTNLCKNLCVDLSSEMIEDCASVTMNQHLTEFLASCIADADIPANSIVSGAGHDAVAMSKLCPVSMFFVRCKEGISHHPDESVDVADVAVALQVMTRFILKLAQENNIE